MAPGRKRQPRRAAPKAPTRTTGAKATSASAARVPAAAAKQQEKTRDSFTFGGHYEHEDDHMHGGHHHHGQGQQSHAHHHHHHHHHRHGKSEPCPEKNSDSELERECAPMLPPRCKTYDRSEDQNEEERSILFREPPDFELLDTYNDYLDHYVSWKDLAIFQSEEIARTIVKLGYRVPELLSKEQFETVMKDIRAKRFEKRRDDIHISWEIQSEIKTPLMRALADREVANRNGSLNSIIYIRANNGRNEEVSAWIDFRSRLKADDNLWYDYFSGKRKLLPRQSDLCFYNWSTFQIRFNSSANYLVTTDIKHGLQFMNKLDRKLITVNPRGSPGDNTDAIHIRDTRYMQTIVYDHFLRIKA